MYTNVAKPTGTPYTSVNPQGKEQYDQSDVDYDDADVYYDTINWEAYTKVQQPTVAWNLDRASLFAEYDISGQTTYPESLFFNPDGTKMYVSDGNVGTVLYEYDLSTAWDLSTRAVNQSKNFNAQVTYLATVYFRSDGLKLFICDNGSVTDNELIEYDMSVAWDISTTTFLQRKSIHAQDAQPEGLYFRPDGMKVFIVGLSGAEVNEYDTASGWNISTLVFRQRLSVSAQTSEPDSVFFRSDGNRMFITSGKSPSSVFQYNLLESWNVATAQYASTLTVSASDINTFAAFFREDGLRLFVTSATDDDVKEYRFSEEYTKVSKPT